MSKKNEDINIVYTSILREKHTILSEYTECSGNFAQIIRYIMEEIIAKFNEPPDLYRTYFFYGKYAIFIIKYKKLYILTMFPNIKINNTEIIFSLLFCIFEKLKSKKEIDLENIKKMRAYSLNDFSLVLKDQIKIFDSNSEAFISYLKNSKDFILYEPFENRNYEEDIQLPILSNIQVHNEKKKENEEIIKEKDENDISMRKSYNSILTQDSFRDDILNKDRNEKLVEDNQLDLIIKKDPEEDSDVILKEKNRDKYKIKNKNRNKCLILIVILLILICISLGAYFYFK